MADPNGSADLDDTTIDNVVNQNFRPNFSRIEFPKLTDTHSVEYWFIRLESWFRLQGITEETVRFEAVVASLTPQLFDQVVDVIISPPQNEPYKRLKAAIIEKFADSEYTRVDKLLSTVPLGGQRPSHLLAEIRRAGATRVGCGGCRLPFERSSLRRRLRWVNLQKWPTQRMTRYKQKTCHIQK